MSSASSLRPQSNRWMAQRFKSGPSARTGWSSTRAYRSKPFTHNAPHSSRYNYDYTSSRPLQSRDTSPGITFDNHPPLTFTFIHALPDGGPARSYTWQLPQNDTQLGIIEGFCDKAIDDSEYQTSLPGGGALIPTFFSLERHSQQGGEEYGRDEGTEALTYRALEDFKLRMCEMFGMPEVDDVDDGEEMEGRGHGDMEWGGGGGREWRYAVRSRL